MIPIGLQDAHQAARYYDLFDRNGYVLDTRFDQKLLEPLRQKGTFCSRFLLGGCASRQSLSAMEMFICWLRPETSSTLVVVDEQELALARLQDEPAREGIARLLVQEDLLRISELSLGAPFDYIRLDYLQNFVDLWKQESLLRSLKSVLASHGVIASVVSMVVGEESQARGMEEGRWGCRVVFDEDVGYYTVDLSRRYLERVSTRVGLSLRYGESRIVESYEDDEDGSGYIPVLHVDQYVVFSNQSLGLLPKTEV